MTFQRDAHLLVRLDLENGANVVNVLQRNEIRVAVKLVVRRKKILERSMLAVRGIAVAGTVGVFEAKPRCAEGLGDGVAALHNRRVSFVIEPRGRRAGASIAEISKLTHQIERVIPRAK